MVLETYALIAVYFSGFLGFTPLSLDSAGGLILREATQGTWVPDQVGDKLAGEASRHCGKRDWRGLFYMDVVCGVILYFCQFRFAAAVRKKIFNH